VASHPFEIRAFSRRHSYAAIVPSPAIGPGGKKDVVFYRRVINKASARGARWRNDVTRLATFQTANTWPTGLTANIEIAVGTDPLDGWTVSFDAPWAIDQIWNATILSHVGSHYVIGNLDYNAVVAAGGTLSFGFNATGDATAAPAGLNVAEAAEDGGGGSGPVDPPVDPGEGGGTGGGTGGGSGPAHGAEGWLHTDGSQIVDSAGQEFKISAVNWFGMEGTNYAPGGLDVRSYTSMMDQMVELGFNAIRLPFSNQLFDAGSTPRGINFGLNPDLQGLTGLQIMDKIVDYAGKIGLRLILDNHRSAAGDGTQNGLWYDSHYTESRWISDWKMLAGRYADDPTVIGFDLHNEPHASTWGDGSATTDWQAAATRAGNAVLGVNPNLLVIVEGIANYGGDSYWWGGNLQGVKDHPVVLNVANQLVYSPHDYPNSIYAQPWFNTPDFPKNLSEVFSKNWGYIFEQNIAPIFVGELGTKLLDPKDAAWLASITAYLGGDLDGNGTNDLPAGAEGASWAWWSWNPNSGDTGGILKDDWTTVQTGKMDAITPIQFHPDVPASTTPSAGDDVLTGTAGNDRLSALGGNDVLMGLGGKDTLDGGTGADAMTGGAGDDTYIVDNAGDKVIELADQGNDWVRSSVSFTLGANVEHLQLTGSGDISGTGNAVFNRIIGNTGDNLLDGKGGNDQLEGGAGDDTYVVDNTRDRVIELASQGLDTVQASVSFTLAANVENLLLTGTGNINGTGNALANRITGNAGNNLLDGKGGADQMEGGAGNDTYVVDAAGDKIVELAGQGTDSVRASVSHILAANVENLQLTGTGGLSGTGNDLSNRIIGNAGNNLLDGKGGADQMEGGAGNDTYVVDNSSDRVIELAGAGTDLVQASVTHTLATNVENLLLTGTGNINGSGNALANRITGNAGNNLLDGKGGADQMDGGAGNDSYVVDNTGDKVVELADQGTDWVRASISFTLGANVENLLLTGTGTINGTGNGVANQILGNDAANRLVGLGGDDLLVGNGGNDMLSGGTGNNRLYGGQGADSFLFDAQPGAGNLNRIFDFTVGEDKVLLDRSVFTGLGAAGALNEASFGLGSTATTAAQRVLYDAASDALFYDADGAGGVAAVRIGVVVADHVLHAQDIWGV
jgi:Ca2+-binding RTX toxin-like protein